MGNVCGLYVLGLICVLSASGCQATRPYSMTHDVFAVCERSDGTYYNVDVSKGRCLKGEATTDRCLLSDGTIKYVRSEKECTNLNGRALGHAPN
jgi:hypothetical protein